MTRGISALLIACVIPIGAAAQTPGADVGRDRIHRKASPAVDPKNGQ